MLIFYWIIKTGTWPLFSGNEKSGLTNEELQICDVVCSIPASPEFPSLNLAHAVMVTLYQIRNTRERNRSDRAVENNIPVSREDFDGMLSEIKNTLTVLGFFKTVPSSRLTNYLRKLMIRAKLDNYDIHVIKNLFSRISGMVKKLKKQA